MAGGIRASLVVIITSFLLGALFTHWIADSLTLWKSPVTDEHLWSAAAYYAVLARMSTFLAYIPSTLTVLGATTLLWSLRDGEAGNLMFDTASIFLFGSAVFVYMNNVLPNVREHFTTLSIPEKPEVGLSGAPFPPLLRDQTLDLASSHLVCSVALTGVLLLQAARWWSEQKDIDEPEVEASQPATRAVSTEPTTTDDERARVVQ